MGGVTYQFVPPGMHMRNTAERVIHTLKEPVLAFLVGASVKIFCYFWYLLRPQAELTINLLQQLSANPKVLK